MPLIARLSIIEAERFSLFAQTIFFALKELLKALFAHGFDWGDQLTGEFIPLITCLQCCTFVVSFKMVFLEVSDMVTHGAAYDN